MGNYRMSFQKSQYFLKKAQIIFSLFKTKIFAVGEYHMAGFPVIFP